MRGWHQLLRCKQLLFGFVHCFRSINNEMRLKLSDFHFVHHWPEPNRRARIEKADHSLHLGLSRFATKETWLRNEAKGHFRCCSYQSMMITIFARRNLEHRMEPSSEVVAVVEANFERNRCHAFLLLQEHRRGSRESQVDEVSNWRAACSCLKGAEEAAFGHMSKTRQIIEVDRLIEMRFEVTDRFADTRHPAGVGISRSRLAVRSRQIAHDLHEVSVHHELKTRISRLKLVAKPLYVAECDAQLFWRKPQCPIDRLALAPGGSTVKSAR
jgi:hypothetical protein